MPGRAAYRNLPRVPIRRLMERRRKSGGVRQHENRELEELRAVTRAIFANTSTAICIKDRDRRYVTVSRGMEEMTGRDAASMLGLVADDLLPEPIAQKSRTTDERVLAGDTVQFEDTVHIDGQERTFVVDKFPLRTETGDIFGIGGITTEVTPHRAAERQLRDAEARYRQMIETSTEGICMIDCDAVATVANARLAQMLGVEREEIVGASIVDFVRDEDHELVLHAVAARKPIHGEHLRLRRRDGGIVHARISSTPVTTDDGQVAGQMAMLSDVTAAREADAERAALERRLHETQRLGSLGRLVSGVAHDFNNLLSVIINYAEFASSQAEGDLKDDIAEISSAAAKAAELTNQLLVFSRGDMPQPQDIDVNERVRDVAQLLSRTVGEHVSLSTELAPRVPRVRIDPSRFEQILVNLVVNARDATADGGRLAIRTRAVDTPRGEVVSLAVSDTGCGMPRDVVEHACEPFFTTKAKFEGTGLGLATVHGIVTETDGDIKISSVVGEGTTVTVELPAVQARHEREHVSTSAEAAAGSAKRILLVEDEESVRSLTRRILSRKGYTVLDTASPRRAIELAEESDVDLLLTDVVMPGMSGPDLAEALVGAHPGLKVLFMSGYGDNGERLPEGTKILGKPFDADALAEHVAQALAEVN